MAQIKNDTIARGPNLFEKAELTLHGFLTASNKSSTYFDETGVRDAGLGNAVRNAGKSLLDLGYINEERDGPRPGTPPRIGLFSNTVMNTQTEADAKMFGGRPPYMTAYEPTAWTAKTGWASDFPL
jgi:hypothetical protein